MLKPLGTTLVVSPYVRDELLWGHPRSSCLRLCEFYVRKHAVQRHASGAYLSVHHLAIALRQFSRQACDGSIGMIPVFWDWVL